MENYSYNDVSKLFHLTVLQASIQLGIELQEMKKLLKRLNIDRWPYSYKKTNHGIAGPAQFIQFKVELQKPIVIIKKSQKMVVKNLLN